MGRGKRSRHQILLDRERKKLDPLEEVILGRELAIECERRDRQVSTAIPNMASERVIMSFRIVTDDLHTLQKQLEVFTERQIEVMGKSLEATIERLKKIDEVFFPPPLPPKPQYFYGGGSAGAVFRLICSDGKADRLIMATKLLDKRLREIRKGRERLEGLCGDLAYEISKAVKLIERIQPERRRLRIESCARVLMDHKLPEELVGIITGFAFDPRPLCPPEQSSACSGDDGRADRLIMATRLLNERLRDVMGGNEGNRGPTLADIEHTHTLFVNAHFRPLPFGNVAMPMGDFMRDSIAYVRGSMPLSAYMRKKQEREARKREKEALKKKNRRNRARCQLVQLAHVLPGDVVKYVDAFLIAQ